MFELSFVVFVVSVMVGVGLVMYLLGIDGNVLLGGFGGVIFFVVFVCDYNVLICFGYLLVFWVGGYYVGIEVFGCGLIQISGMVVFVVVIFCVIGGIGMFEWMCGGELFSWMCGLLCCWGGKFDG